MTRRPQGWRIGILALASMLMLLVAPVAGIAAQADPATDFNTVIAQLPTMTPVAGPTSGSLDAANADSAAAGVSVANGVAHVDFTVPNVAPGTLWAMSVLFRVSPAGEFFLLVFPDGTWQLANGQQGSMANGIGTPIDTTPGATVAIDVVFNGAAGSFGVNGAFVSALDLTAIQDAGDVQLSGYLGLGAGATTLDYTNFTVYDLGGAAAQPTTAAGLPTAAPPVMTPTQGAAPTEAALPTEAAVPTTASTGDPAATFAQYLALEGSAPTVFGPQSGVMLHDPAKVTFLDTGVTVTDFGAHIECIAPRSAAELWDCGLAFRDTNTPNHYRLGVVSDGHWFLSIANQSPLVSGSDVPFPPNAGDRIALDLFVVGNTGYFGVDGTFVSELDLSAIAGPGSVSAVIGFFDETFIEGGQTAYENFAIWDLTGGAVPPAETVAPGIPTVAPTVALPPVESPTPAAAITEVPPVVESPTVAVPSGLVGVTGNTYVSPTFGYTLTWDSTWTATDATSLNQVDVLRLTNGVTTTDLYSGASSMTLEECVTSLVTFYQNDPSYTNVVLQPYPNGQTILVQGNVSTAILTFDLSDGTITTPTTDSVICVSIPTAGALVSMESYGPTDQFASQQAAIDALQAQLVVDGAPVVLPTAGAVPVATEAPTVAVPAATETPASGTTGETGQNGRFTIDPIGGSGVSGIGTVSASDRTVTVSAVLIGATPGSTVGISRGTCAELTNVLEPDYYVGEIDEAAIVQASVPVRLSVLLSRGPYSIVVYGPGDGAPMVACGEIVGG